jgi:beta-alanine--pyruvate transaminase
LFSQAQGGEPFVRICRSGECAKRCFDEGILIRSSGDTLVVSPPLFISESEIEMVFATIRRALDALD